MYNIFSLIRKGNFSQKMLSMFVAFALLLQSVAAFPLIAQADVTVAVTDSSGTTSHYTLATSTDNVAISYTLPAGAPTTTPTLDALSSILSSINTALVSATASTSCSGSGSATANASASATISLDGTSVVATAKASSKVDCTPAVEPPPAHSPVTIVAEKVVCDDVSMLPKWGNGGSDISSTTAKDYVASHAGCHLTPDWKFQWGFGANDSSVETGVKDLSGDFVGEADGSKGQGTNTGTGYSDWKTFGPTNLNGSTSVQISDFGTAKGVWVREVLKSGYVPFTFDPAHQSNANATSAEMYCANDVINYDNYEFINRPVSGAVYHCVAFNALKQTPPPPPPVCAVDVVSDATNHIDLLSGSVYATSTYNQNPRWTAFIPGATWIWETFFVQNPLENEFTTFVKEFNVPGTIASSTLVVASDNSYTVSINGVLVGADNTEFNYFEEGKDAYNVASFLHLGTNTISFTVKNWALPGSTPETNPAGLLYKLHVGLYGDGCGVPPPPEANTAPVITVLPPNPMTLTLGDTFTDPGATAFDMEDGTITPQIVKTGSVNTSATGTYTIFYNVKDSKGLAAVEKTRTVIVVAPQICVAPLDVMLVIDRSGSMTDDNNPQLPLTKAKAAATTFIGTLSTTTDHVGVVSYNETATLNRALTSNFTAAKSSIASITATGATNIGDAFNKASLEMTTNGRPSAKHVIILLSDGLPNMPTNVASGTAYALSQATIAKSKGYVVYTIGLGTDVNPALMKQLATTPSDYYFAPTTSELDAIYRTIAAEECGRVPGTISGKKINDRAGNGIIDGNDVGIPDWQITLTSVGDNNATSRIAKTNANGEYIFGDIFAGTYLICEVGKSGWIQTAPATTTNGCYSIEVTPGAQISGKNFLNTETIKPQCSDGKDNDGDGKIDYPQDTGCDSTNDNDENNKPVITVLGDNPLTLAIGAMFVDPGATASDPEDGNITTSIIKTGTVNTAAVGTYTITYNVKDSKGLSAETKTRTVIVTSQCSDGKDNDGDGKIDMTDAGCDNPNDNDENNKPVITVLGANPFDVTVGTTFTDPGATAFDMEDGTITPQIVKTGSVNTSATGTYTIFYNVKDSKGLAAVEKTRTVRVNSIVTECSDGKDNDGDGKIDYPADTGCDSTNDNDENNKPVITVLGDNPYTVHIGTLFTDPGATAFDMEDGTITPVVATGTVNTLQVGVYTITYNVKDSKGLAATEKTRTVNVVSSCSDGKDNDGDGKIDYPADTGCENPNDDSENQAPVLTLLGDVVMNIFVGTTFTDPGATAFDQEDGTITPKIIYGGTVNQNTLGAYFLTYNVTDSGGLSAPTKTRTVNVITQGCTQNCGGGGGGSDNNRPIITLIGANPLIVTQGTSFIDPGATAVDPEDGDVTAKIVVGGTVNTSNLGDYELTYNVADSKGLPAVQVKRTVTVVQGGGGGGGGSITLSIFNEKIAVTATTTVVVSWNTNQPADSRVVYGLDSHATLGSAPLYGYQLTTATDASLVTTHSVTINGIPSAIATYFRPVSTDGVRTATGIELTRTPVIEIPAQCFYLKEYMRLGANNNPEEVTKLQTFLRDYEGFTNLRVTGFFDITTDQAVRSFQDKYTADVLTPWKLPGNTGYVYYTTQKKVNEIYCQRAFPLNSTQIAEIAAFRELIDRINAQGAEGLPTLPLVGVNTRSGGVGGSVAGVTTETGGAIAGGVSTTSDTSVPQNRGRIALADLLATMPTVTGSLLDGSNTPSLGTSPGAEESGSVIATSTTKRGLAAVVKSISARTKLSTGGVYALFVLVIASVVLSLIIGRRYYVLKKVESASKK